MVWKVWKGLEGLNYFLNKNIKFIMVWKVWKFGKILAKSRTNRTGIEKPCFNMILPLIKALNIWLN